MFWLLERGLCNFTEGLLNKVKKKMRRWVVSPKKGGGVPKKITKMAHNPCITGNPVPKS